MLFGSGIPMDIVVYTPLEVASELEKKFSFVYKVFHTGKLVYERGH
jgi:hypothetical protein